MKKFLAALRRKLPKWLVPVLAVGFAVGLPVAIMAWGPDRPTYTVENPAPHVTFNSITNNPAHGDERNFVQVKAADAPDSAYAESVNLEAGKEYTVYIYYHNNAASNLNASGKGIAQNAYVRAALPAVVNGSADVVGHVGASNAQPQTDFWDEASFKSSSAMAIRYVPGSATIHSFGKVDGKQLSDSVITSGAPIGYDALDGKLPGCNEFAGYVTLKVKADQPNFTVNKTVRLNGTKEWKDSIQAKAGDKVDYQIEYKNTGTTEQKDVVIKDILPAGMTYENGSTKFVNATSPNGAPATDGITTTGINLGNYSPGANVYVKFSATLPKEEALQCGTNTFRNVARAETNNGSKEDDANVNVPKECQPPKAVVECKGLDVIQKTETQFTFQGKKHIENADFVKYVYTVRNEKGDVIKTIESTNDNAVAYENSTPGKYSVKVDVVAKVGNEIKTVSGAHCEKQFEVKRQEVKPEYACDYLKKIDQVGGKVTFEAKGITKGNVTIKEYTVDYGDNQKATQSIGQETFTHEYAPGDYTAKLSVTFGLEGGKTDTKTASTCEVKIHVEQPPVVPPAPETPETPQQPEAPGVLPSTGPESILAGIVGSSALGYGVHAFAMSRRKLARIEGRRS